MRFSRRLTALTALDLCGPPSPLPTAADPGRRIHRLSAPHGSTVR